MIFVLRGIGVAGDVFEAGVFPVEVDPVGVEVVGQLSNAAHEISASAVCCEYVGAGFTAAPAAEGKDDFEIGVFVFQSNHVADSCSVVGVGDIEEVAFEVAEAKYDVCQFFGGEAVDGAAAAGVVADDGGAFCVGPGMVVGEMGCGRRIGLPAGLRLPGGLKCG